jgi:hypothetical protein
MAAAALSMKNAVKPLSGGIVTQTRMNTGQEIWTFCSARFDKLDIAQKHKQPHI